MSYACGHPEAPFRARLWFKGEEPAFLRPEEVGMPAAPTSPCSEHLDLLDDPRFQSAAVVEAVLRAAYASGMDDADEVDPLLAEFAFKRLAELQAAYLALFGLFWSDEETAKQEFKELVATFLAKHGWPWPVTEVGLKGSGKRTDFFERDESGLRICGYRVGKTEGMPDPERRRFLDHFFCNPLPAVVQRVFGGEYGTPRSEQRLRKMANVIAANCRNFKRNDPQKYSVAIDHYETDLAYLKARYYRPAMFVWPETEPF
jgi:hypothetical protein